MCGINGFVSKQFNPDKSKEIINRMNDQIIHRGPEDDGYYQEGNVALGMRRLSIIDLVSGKQPIIDETGNYVIVFNGEIYNYQKIRADLEKKNYTFKTKSDTEVLLKAYIAYGVKCLDHLNGMFAFAILDKVNKQLFIARDRLGEKPLIYYKDSNKFVFASELKSIVNCIRPEFPLEIDKPALRAYLRYTFIPSPLTIYKNIYKLEPAHYLIVNVDDLSLSKHKYWDTKPVQNTGLVKSYDEAKQQVLQVVNESTKMRLVSDVPLGVFLSGGIDSSIIAYSMASQSGQRIKTFSIGFSHYKSFDETAQAQRVAKFIGSEHHQFDLDFDDMRKDIEKIVLNYDEPFADSSALPSYWVSKITSDHVTVALTGDGGDEAFGGYNRYLVELYGKKLFFLNYLPKELSAKIVNLLPEREENRNGFKFRMLKLIKSHDKDIYRSFLKVISMGFQESELSEILLDDLQGPEFIETSLKDKFANYSSLKMMRNIDRLISLDGDMCVKVDRASMLTSIECRAPYLDHRIFELTNTFPDKFLLDGNNKKKILKDAF